MYQCELCPTTCGRKTDLRLHVQKLHTSERPMHCKMCGKSFPDRWALCCHLSLLSYYIMSSIVILGIHWRFTRRLMKGRNASNVTCALTAPSHRWGSIWRFFRNFIKLFTAPSWVTHVDSHRSEAIPVWSVRPKLQTETTVKETSKPVPQPCLCTSSTQGEDTWVSGVWKKF